MAASELVRHGWHLSEDGIAKCSDEGKRQHCDSIIKRALDVDLKEIGDTWLPEDINRGRIDCLEGPAVLQLSKLRVVSAPKDNEESQTAPRLCRVSLTDGHTTCSGVLLEAIKGLSPNTPPGSKVLLSGPVEVESNFLLLTGKNIRFLGGNVNNLASAWELKKTLAQQTLIRNNIKGDGGPPPFVPFGTKISKTDPIPSTKKDFKSLASEKDKDAAAEDDEFQQQRQATIKQALQAKSSGQGAKASFGGGQKQLVKDTDVARIMEMGFSAPDASIALKSCGGNVQEAINSLLSGGPPRGGMGGRFQDRGRPGPRGNNFQDGREGGRGDRRRGGRDQRGGDGEEGDEDYHVSKPSGPATLFDFLDAKLFSKEDSKKADKSSTSSKQSAPSSSSSFSNTATSTTSASTNHSNSKYNPPGYHDPVFKHSNYSRKQDGRPNMSQGFSSNNDSSSSNYHNRPSSNYNQRGGGGGGYSNGGEFGGCQSYKGHQESNSTDDDGMIDKRQHTTLPPRFAKQRTESHKGDVGDYESKQRGHHSDTRQPLLENNNSYNNQGRYDNNNYSSPPSHSHPHPHSSDSRNQRQPYNSQHNKAAESSSNSHSYNKDNQNNKKENASSSLNDNTTTTTTTTSSGPSHHNSQQQPRYSNYNQHGYNNSRNPSQFNEASNNDRHHHPADRGASNKYNNSNSRNGMNPYQNYRHQQQYQDQPPPPPRQDSRGGQYNNPKSRIDRRFPDGGVQFQVGDMCMAKYWEDNKYYSAVVDALGPPGTTLLVQFLDYGNQEEVLVSDVRPMPGGGQMGGGQWGYPPHSFPGDNMAGSADFDPSNFGDGGPFVPPMQFSRSQGGYMKGNNRKPTQSFYTPPSYGDQQARRDTKKT